MASFAGHPMFRDGFSAPTRFEATIHDCEVIGRIPSDIHGTFYRLQCDFQYAPPKNEWATGFNGDGHVSMFRFANGSVDYRGRYVKTERLMAERAARKRLFGVYRNPFTDDPSVQDVHRSAANTHIYWHGGKLLALKEDSQPYSIDPHTLDTYGPYDFNGKYKAETFSAHPKIDPVSGEMVAYGYQAKGLLTDDVAFYVMDRSGQITREVWLKAPFTGIMHDIAITQKHIVLPVVPMTSTMERLKAGEPMWEWNANQPTMVGVFRRDGDAKDVRWFKGPPRMTLHFLNAVTEGNKVVMELPVSDSQGSPSMIKRWIFDLNSKKDEFQEEIVCRANGVLARMDDRFTSIPYRYGYVGNRDPALTGKSGRPLSCYQRFDLRSNEIKTFAAVEGQSLQEPCFVPRKANAPEGDGYVIGVANNTNTMSSDLVIVDALRMEEGAIATVKLPFRLRGGTHGAWMPATDLPFSA
jgi:carotenoid cleavage dioxygenase-like enzyme